MAGELPLDDAWAVAGMLVTTGRAVPPSKWVDSLILQSKEAELEGLF